MFDEKHDVTVSIKKTDILDLITRVHDVVDCMINAVKFLGAHND